MAGEHPWEDDDITDNVSNCLGMGVMSALTLGSLLPLHFLQTVYPLSFVSQFG